MRAESIAIPGVEILEPIGRGAESLVYRARTGQDIVVGVNKYELQDEVPIEILKVDATLEQKQIDRVQALKAQRDSGAVEAALGRLKEDAARDDRNLMGPIVDASRANVTMGEMCDALREVWGVWRETPVF